MADISPKDRILGQSCVHAGLLTPATLDGLWTALRQSPVPGDLKSELLRRGLVTPEQLDLLRTDSRDLPAPSATIPFPKPASHAPPSIAPPSGPTGTVMVPLDREPPGAIAAPTKSGPTGTVVVPPSAGPGGSVAAPAGAGPTGTVVVPLPTGPTGTIAVPAPALAPQTGKGPSPSPSPSPSNAPTSPALASSTSPNELPPEAAQAAQLDRNCFGKYILVRVLGSGGMAVVHLAWDTLLHQWVALKFIKTGDLDGSDGEEGRRMLDAFLAEARLTVKLNHPNIARVFELGQIDDRHYMSQFYVDGPSLHEVVHGTKARSEETRFYTDPRRYVLILRDIAAAMAYAHSLNPPVIHRDLKPANVMLDSSGRAYVVDFGLAKEIRAGQTSLSGLVKGTPKYMAPEQAEGRSHDMDGRTDIWAIGVILYEMLTGRGPFEHENLHHLLSMIATDEPQWPRHVVNQRTALVAPGTAGAVHVPRDLEVIAMKCLQKDRRHRYATAHDLVADLQSYLQGEKVALPQHSAYWFLEKMGRLARKHRWTLIPLVLATAALGVAGLLFWRRGSSSGPRDGIPPARWEAASRVRDQFLQTPSENTLSALVGLLGTAEAPLVPVARQGVGSWWMEFTQTREMAVRTLYGPGPPRREWLQDGNRRRARDLLTDLAFARRINEHHKLLGLSERDPRDSERLLEKILEWKGVFTVAADVHPWATFRLQVDGRELPRDAARQENATPVRIAEVPVGSLKMDFSRGEEKGSVTVPAESLRDGAVLRIWGTLDQLHTSID